MTTVQVTDKNFDQTVEKGLVVLDFWAEWCAPCRAFAPVFEAAAKKHPQVKFGKVDTEAEPALAALFSIRAIPTLAVMRDGVLLAVQPGMVPAAALDQLVAKAQALDMDDVKKQMEAARARSADQNPQQQENA